MYQGIKRPQRLDIPDKVKEVAYKHVIKDLFIVDQNSIYRVAQRMADFAESKTSLALGDNSRLVRIVPWGCGRSLYFFPLYQPSPHGVRGGPGKCTRRIRCEIREAGKALTERTLSLTQSSTVAEKTAQR